MARDAIALEIDDVSAFARTLRSALSREADLPGHLGLLNHIARAAGFRNFQHLRAGADAVPTVPVDERRLAQARRCFDAQGRMARWPAKTGLQGLCLWALWARLPARRDLTETEVNAVLDHWHTFGDRALLRRSLIDHRLAERTVDGRVYRRREAEPAPEARALLRGLAGRGG